MAGITGDNLFSKDFLNRLDEASQKAGKLNVDLTKLEETLRKGINEGFDRLSKELKDVSVGASDTSSRLSGLEAQIKSLKLTSSQLNSEMSKLKALNKQQEEELSKLRKEYEKLAASQAQNTKATNAQANSLGALAKRYIGLTAGILLVERGVRMFTQQIRLAVDSSIQFEQVMKEVMAISRATSDQFRSLEADANRLGASTEKTAVQVAGLQKELAKLGFAPSEIIASADAIIDLSTATGEDLVQSATVAAATLRAFGMEAVEMTRLVDTMAGSFVRSGLDLEKFRESMKLVAPLARAANVDLETTTAALSKLADAGLSGSLAGTALRNLISEMADPTSDLSKRLGFVVENSTDMITAFRQLKEEGVGLAEAVQMIDVRARPAFFTIMNNIDSVDALAREYRSLSGEGERIAEMMRDTLANDIEISNSAFDAMRRDLAEDFSPMLRDTFQNLTLLSEGIRLTANDTISWTDAIIGNNSTLKEWANNIGDVLSFLATGTSDNVSDFQVIWNGIKNTIREAQLEEEFNRIGEEVKSSMEVINESMDVQANVVPLIKEYRNLQSEMDEGGKASARMAEIQKILVSRFGQTAIMIDRETQEISLNTAELERQAIAKDKEAKNIIKINEERGKEIKTKRMAMLEELKMVSTTEDVTKAVSKYVELGPEIAKLEQEWVARLPIIQQELVNTAQNGWSVLTGSIDKYQKALGDLGAETDEVSTGQGELQVALAKLAEQRAKIAVDEESDILRRIELEESYRDARMHTAQVEFQLQLESIKGAEDEAQKKEILEVELQKTREGILANHRAVIKAHYKELSEMDAKALQERLKDIEQNNRKILEEYKQMASERLEIERGLNAEVDRLRSLDAESEERWREEQSRASFHRVEADFQSEQRMRTMSANKLIKMHKGILDAHRQRAEEGKLLTKEEEESVKESMEAISELTHEKAKAMQDVMKETFASISTLAQELAENQMVIWDNELKRIDALEKAKLEIAGDNAELKIKIEEEADKKRAEIQRKQAEAEKKMAIFNIAIRTAQGVMSALAQFPPNPVLAGIIAAAGVAQAVIVANREIPAFAEGTDNAPGGMALVGDGGGAELVWDKGSNKAFLTPDKPTLMNINKGSKVFTALETEKLLRGVASKDHNDNINKLLGRATLGTERGTQIDQDRLEKAFDKAVKKIPLTEHNYDERGYSRYKRRVEDTKRYLNKKHGTRW